MLDVRNLSISFGGNAALSNVTFSVADDELVGLIGPNGAGKTTLLNCISQLYHYQKGTIAFNSLCLDGLSPRRIVMAGVARTFQNLAIFPSLPVIDNVMVGAHDRNEQGFLSAMLGRRSTVRTEAKLEAEALALLRVFGLQDRAYEIISSIPFALQKRIEICRALMAKPLLLLLDEPAIGLSDEELRALADWIRAVKVRYKLSIVLIEHHLDFVTQLVDRLVVLNFGTILAQGSPDTVMSEKCVRDAYIGDDVT